MSLLYMFIVSATIVAIDNDIDEMVAYIFDIFQLTDSPVSSSANPLRTFPMP